MPAPAHSQLSARKLHALALFAGLPSRYDRMGALLSFGQDPRWRAALVAAIAPRGGQRILDVATGTGMVAAGLARAAPDCWVVGLDQSEQMLAGARARLAREPELAARIELVLGEAERLPFADGEFDALSFTYLLRYVDDRAATMRELARVVRPGGRIAMVEFGVPNRLLLRALWRVHTRAGLPALGRLVSPAWLEVGRFLGPSIERLHAEEPDLPALWRQAGIGQVAMRAMSFGAGLVMWGVREGADAESAGRGKSSDPGGRAGEGPGGSEGPGGRASEGPGGRASEDPSGRASEDPSGRASGDPSRSTDKVPSASEPSKPESTGEPKRTSKDTIADEVDGGGAQ